MKTKVIPAKALPRSRKSEKTKSKDININLVSTKSPKQPPKSQIISTSKGIIVKNYEFCRRVTGSDLSASMFYLTMNPGNNSTFPWLSVLAAGYEKFKIHKLKAHYIHTCAATQNGQYCMYFDYDARDTRLTDIDQAMQNYDRANGAIYTDKTLKYKKSLESMKSYYIQKSTTPSASWVVDETPAKLNMLTSNATDDLFIGNLFLEYEIELEVPAIDIATAQSSLVLAGAISTTSIYDSLKTQYLLPSAPGENFEGQGLRLEFPSTGFGGYPAIEQSQCVITNGTSIGGSTWYTPTTRYENNPSGISNGTQQMLDTFSSNSTYRDMCLQMEFAQNTTQQISYRAEIQVTRSASVPDITNTWAGVSLLFKNGSLEPMPQSSVVAAQCRSEVRPHGLYEYLISFAFDAVIQCPSNRFGTMMIMPNFFDASYPYPNGTLTVSKARAGLFLKVLPAFVDYAALTLSAGILFSKAMVNFLTPKVEIIDTSKSSAQQGYRKPPVSLDGTLSKTLSEMRLSDGESFDRQANPRPPILRTPHTFRDHTSRFDRSVDYRDDPVSEE